MSLKDGQLYFPSTIFRPSGTENIIYTKLKANVNSGGVIMSSLQQITLCFLCFLMGERSNLRIHSSSQNSWCLCISGMTADILVKCDDEINQLVTSNVQPVEPDKGAATDEHGSAATTECGYFSVIVSTQ